jgi:ubiquinone/menaquinone biosynthesis C-methylase UbiE
MPRPRIGPARLLAVARVDYDEMSERYNAGRHLDDWQVEPMKPVLRRHVSREADRLLDLGSGTGQWSGRLARWLDVEVVGVEPSAGMRSNALVYDGVRYVAGAAEHVPLRASSIDAAWLSVVVHHFDDLGAAAHELRRVVKPGGPLLLRTGVPDLMPRTVEPVKECVRAAGMTGTVMYPGLLFPTSLAVIDSFPSLADLDAAFGAAGFARVDARLVAHGQARSMREFRDRVAVRADSTLTPVPEKEWRRGMARLDDLAAAEREPVPVVAALPFVAYR